MFVLLLPADKPVGSAMPASQRMNLSIVLPLRDQGDLQNLLAQLYDPSSPDYQHFLSVDEFIRSYGPTTVV
jgi:subtilase family serine protease